MLVHKISERISARLTDYIGWQEKKTVITYGLELIIGESIKFGLLIAFSAILGLLTVTGLLLVTAVPYRLISGGGHCTTYSRCTLTTLFIYLLLAALVKILIPFCNNTVFGVILPLIVLGSLLVIRQWAPGKNPGKQFTLQEMVKFKKLSLYFVALWAVTCLMVYLVKPDIIAFYFVPTATGILWQDFVVSPVGYQFLNGIEKLFDLLKSN